MPGDVDRPPAWRDRPYHRRTIRMQCFPVYSVLLAMGNPVVDYFSLDIEGAEYPVLKTIPFEKVCGLKFKMGVLKNVEQVSLFKQYAAKLFGDYHS